MSIINSFGVIINLLWGASMKFRANDYNKGEILKFMRQWTGLTQAQFAEVVGKSAATIKDYEQNRTSYSIDTLLKIAEEFNMTITIHKKNHEDDLFWE